MRHFDISQWVDFTRGVTDQIDRSAMDAHLSSGCKRCRHIVSMLETISETMRTDEQYEPPEYVLRLARAIYVPPAPKRLIAQLIYDSFGEPLPAGVRSQDRLTRHTLFQAGSYYVDLRVEHQPSGKPTTLMGQIADRARPGVESSGSDVLLKKGRSVLAQAPCNRFGEFHLACRPAAALKLEIRLAPQGTRLELPLAGLMDESATPRGWGKKGKKS